MRFFIACAAIFVAGLASGQDAPKLVIPANIAPVGGYVRFTPETNANLVVYVPLDDAYPFPSEELRDGRRFILPVAGLKDGIYRFVAIATLNDVPTVAQFSIKIGTLPQPPPPGPKPEPKPVDPKPAVKTFRVFIVNESGQTLTAKQNSAIYAADVRSYLDARTTAEAGVKGWLVIDKDSSLGQGYGPEMRKLWDAVKPKVTATPCVAIEVNGLAEIVPLPDDAAAMLNLLKKYRGE